MTASKYNSGVVAFEDAFRVSDLAVGPTFVPWREGWARHLLYPAKFVFDPGQAVSLAQALRALGASTRFRYVETEGYASVEAVRATRFSATFDLSDYAPYASDTPIHAYNGVYSEEGTWAASLADSFGIAVVAGQPKLMSEWEMRLDQTWDTNEAEAVAASVKFFSGLGSPHDFGALRSLVSAQPL
jgi:hypothetical protein